MKIAQAVYRTQQFWMAWRAQPLTEEDLTSANKVLTAKQMQLFTRLQPSEQVHALGVLRTIQQLEKKNPDLQTAALLHDIGKARAPLKLWERVVIVLGKSFFPRRVKSWGQGQPRGWKRPFVIAEQHPDWGADMASEVGVSDLAVSLIRRHQSSNNSDPVSTIEDDLLTILQHADHQN